MKQKQIPVSLLTSLIAIVSSAMHAEDCCMPSYMPDEPLCEDQTCTIYSQYAGIQLDCGWNVYGWGEFLYWAVTRIPVIEATTFEGTPPGSTQLELSQKLGFRPGFRVGIGMVAHNFDDWMFNLDYTRFHQTYKQTFSRNLPITLASTLIPIDTAPIYSSIRNKSHFGYDLIGANIQRPNYLGQRVILSPFLGLKWMSKKLVLDQDLIQSGTGLVDVAHAPYKCQAIGVAAGFDGAWLLCWGLRMIGKADVSLLYLYQRRLSQVITFANGAISTEGGKLKTLGILGKGGMGLGWGQYLCCNRYHVDLAATFDFMADVPKLGFNIGMYESTSVMFYGLTVRGQFDF